MEDKKILLNNTDKIHTIESNAAEIITFIDEKFGGSVLLLNLGGV